MVELKSQMNGDIQRIELSLQSQQGNIDKKLGAFAESIAKNSMTGI